MILYDLSKKMTIPCGFMPKTGWFLFCVIYGFFTTTTEKYPLGSVMSEKCCHTCSFFKLLQLHILFHHF